MLFIPVFKVYCISALNSLFFTCSVKIGMGPLNSFSFAIWSDFSLYSQMALKEHCRERICFVILVCFLGSLLVASPASHCCNTCQFPSSQLCNACNFLQHSRILQHPPPTTLRAFSVSSSDSAQQYLAASSFPISTSYQQVLQKYASSEKSHHEQISLELQKVNFQQAIESIFSESSPMRHHSNFFTIQ